jgi:transcriptional regulator GlxA family with amidase domain
MARGLAVPKATGGGLAPWQVELAVRLLASDLSAGVAVGQVARSCGLSRAHFAKAFKVSIGESPHRWLVRQRLRRAGEMLERTDERISLIASSCGFADQSHLTRWFRTAMGASPAAWRRLRRAGSAPPAMDLALTR